MTTQKIYNSIERDKQVTYLAKRHGKDGTVYYVFIKQIQNKRYSKVIGNSNNMTIAQARLKANQMYMDISIGKFNSAADITVERAINEIFLPYCQSRPNYKLYFSVCTNFIKPLLGSDKVKEISYAVAQETVNRLVQKGYKPETIRKHVVVLNRLFHVLIKHELAFSNPFSHVDRPKVSNFIKVSMTPEESNAFFRICKDLDTLFSLCLALMLFTGLRVSEAISIKTTDISGDYKTLRLPKTKSGEVQQIALSSVASAILKRSVEMSHNEYAFSSPTKLDSHISPPRGAMEEVKKHMFSQGYDISRITMHALRKTFATRCAEATNGDMFMVARQIRHSSPAILNRYVHYHDQSISNVTESVAQSIVH